MGMIDNAKELGQKSKRAIDEAEGKSSGTAKSMSADTETAFDKLVKESESEAARQEEAMHKRNIGLGGVNAGKL